MKWTVGISLYPDRAFYELEVKLFNRTNLAHPYWFWHNAGVPATPGWRFISPARRVVSNRSEILSFPMHNGKDISWVREQYDSIDFFSIDLVDDFFGCYNYDLGVGIIQIADRNEVQGRKMFTWGRDDHSKMWKNLLTDNGGPHGEIQSGCFSTMMVRHMLPAHSQIIWKEWWWPCRDMNGFVWANKDIAFNIGHTNEGIEIAMNSTREFKDASLCILHGSKKIKRIKVDVKPEYPFRKILHNLSSLPIEEMKILFLDSGEKEIACYNPKGQSSTSSSDSIKYWLPFPNLIKGTKVQEYVTRGKTLERMGKRQEAEIEYRRAVEFEPSYANAHYSLGRFLLRRGRSDEAVKHLRLALLAQPFSSETLYHLALALREQGNLNEAWDLLVQVQSINPSSSLAGYILGEIALAKGNFLIAEKYLRKVISYSPRDIRAATLLSIVLRKIGKAKEAFEILSPLLKENPTEEWAMVEHYFVSRTLGIACIPSTLPIKKLLFDDQVILEIAVDYFKVGLVSEALEILEEAHNSQWPILHYWIGYCQHALGDHREAINAVRRGSELSSAYVFPHRPESLKVLQFALKMSPRDSKIEAYIGHLLCAMGDERKAAEWWNLSVEHCSSNSVVWGCLGLYFWKVEKDKKAALQVYKKAIELDSTSWKLLLERDTLLAEWRRHEDRVNLLQVIPKNISGWERIAICFADALLFSQKFEQCIKLLGGISVRPWEGEERARKIYSCALIERGCLKLKKRNFSGAIDDLKESLKFPLNLGKGEPTKYKECTQSYYLLGIASEKNGDKEKSLKFWKKGIAQEEQPNSESCFYQSLCYFRLGRTKESERILQSLEQFSQKSIAESLILDAEPHYILSLVYTTQGKIEEAHKEATAAVKISPTHYGANAFLQKFPSLG